MTAIRSLSVLKTLKFYAAQIPWAIIYSWEELRQPALAHVSSSKKASCLKCLQCTRTLACLRWGAVSWPCTATFMHQYEYNIKNKMDSPLLNDYVFSSLPITRHRDLKRHWHRQHQRKNSRNCTLMLRLNFLGFATMAAMDKFLTSRCHVPMSSKRNFLSPQVAISVRDGA